MMSKFQTPCVHLYTHSNSIMLHHKIDARSVLASNVIHSIYRRKSISYHLRVESGSYGYMRKSHRVASNKRASGRCGECGGSCDKRQSNTEFHILRSVWIYILLAVAHRGKILFKTHRERLAFPQVQKLRVERRASSTIDLVEVIKIQVCTYVHTLNCHYLRHLSLHTCSDIYLEPLMLKVDHKARFEPSKFNFDILMLGCFSTRNSIRSS